MAQNNKPNGAPSFPLSLLQTLVNLLTRQLITPNYSQTELLLEYCCKKNATGCVAHGINTTLLRG